MKKYRFYQAMMTFSVVFVFLTLTMVEAQPMIIILTIVGIMSALGYQNLAADKWKEIRDNASMDRPE